MPNTALLNEVTEKVQAEVVATQEYLDKLNAFLGIAANGLTVAAPAPAAKQKRGRPKLVRDPVTGEMRPPKKRGRPPGSGKKD